VTAGPIPHDVASPSTPGRAGPVRVAGVAVLSTATGALPVFLLGGLAVQVRADLGFTESQLGLAVTVFFAVSALCSSGAGHLTEGVGVRRAMAVTALLVTTGLSVIALSGAWAVVVVGLCIAAVGNAFSQPAANLLIARAITRARQGLAFGVKQSAVPFTSLLGGMAVPVFALTVGWRWAFIAATVCALALVLLTPRGIAAERHRPRRRSRRLHGSAAPLAVLGAAAVLANMGANSLGIFLVETAVARGTAEATAGLLLMGGSAVGITTRFICGWWADRTSRNLFATVAVMLLAGSAGFAGLAFGEGALLLLATALAFSAGWGWNGLFAYAVVDAYRRSPAAATGLAQTGLFLGAMAGPGVFGVTAQHLGFATAWAVMTCCASLAAIGMFAGMRMIRRAARIGTEG
jgi:MFS family permease